MPAILLDSLRFSYPPALPDGPPVEVLRGVSLRVPAGQALAIMGPTSSGKTTLALILAGLAPAMTGGALAGRARVAGLDAPSTPPARLSQSVGLVFQEPERQLFNMTVAEEVAFGLEGQGMPPPQIEERVAWALHRVGLAGLEQRSPWQLSGGQQKRLAIASILAMQPPILLLDEPMAGLDPAGRREVAALLADLKAMTGATVVVMEKEAEFVARWAERVVVLADGQIALDGEPAQVFRQVDRLRALGVATPQMAELAARLREEGEEAAFVTAREGAAWVVRRVGEGGIPQRMGQQRMAEEGIPQRMGQQRMAEEGIPQRMGQQRMAEEGIPQRMGQQRMAEEGIPQRMGQQRMAEGGIPQRMEEQRMAEEGIPQRMEEQRMAEEGIPQRMGQQRMAEEGIPQRMGQQRMAEEGIPQRMGQQRMAEEGIVQRVTDGAPLDGTTPLAVDVRDVRFAYMGGTQALDGVSLAVPQGQFVTLVGPNGGGKSTLARQLNGLLRPQQGAVAVNGLPTAGRPVGELARSVGYVFQNPDHQIFAPTVREEVAFGPRNLGLAGQALAQRVQEALAAFDLSALAEMPPAVLGYGLRRLVTLASVWAMQPPIWLLDEPTTGLDARFTGLLMARLRSLHQAGHTILFITHDLKLAAQAQRVVVISQGRVAIDGPPSVVLAGSAALEAAGLRPPPIARLSALLAPHGFPHPMLSVEQFMETWRTVNGQRPIVNGL